MVPDLSRNSPLINPAALYGSWSRSDVILDASWYLPAHDRDPDAEYLAGHIPHAQRFDFDWVVVDQMSELPHMLPSPAEFQSHARRLGICADSRVVVYDGAGIFAAPRAWWMFRAMGHDNVVVLDGGLPAWKAAGYPLQKGTPELVRLGSFTARPQRERVASAETIRRAIAEGQHQIVDARPPARFAGSAPEPRAGLRPGHMPGALNLPFDRLLENGRFRGIRAISEAFTDAGFDPERPAVASCGSGVTACILAFAGERAVGRPFAVYDGSWAEWGAGDPATMPVATAADLSES